MIRLEGICLSSTGFRMEGLDLTVSSGEYFVLLGPTGSGKTTILDVIAGLRTPQQGRVFRSGEDITHTPPEKRRIGMVAQGYLLFPHLTVRENIQYGMRARQFPDSEHRAQELAALVEIEPLLDRHPSLLSGGEQQRVALARALAVEPEVLLLDEPLGALDPQTRSRLQRDLRRIHERTGATTIHVTHDLEEAVSLADRVGILRAGKLLEVGPPAEVLHAPRTREVAEFVGMENLLSGILRRAPETTGETLFSADGIEISVISDREGPARASIRPEDILISLEPLHSSARNSFAGVIREITDTVSLSRVVVDAGVSFVVTITRSSHLRMNLSPGDRVYVTFKATAVHVF